MAYEIEKDVELEGYGSKYPFKKMKVGDSFFVPHPEAKQARQAALGRNKRKRNPNNPMRFITRTTEGGVRIWRVE